MNSAEKHRERVNRKKTRRCSKEKGNLLRPPQQLGKEDYETKNKGNETETQIISASVEKESQQYQLRAGQIRGAARLDILEAKEPTSFGREDAKSK